MVVECMGDNPEEGVSIRGQDVTAGTTCLAVPPPGQGAPRFLESDECETELADATLMTAMLGRLEQVEPAAAPADFLDEGISGDNDDPLDSRELGASPR
jgi:hypothetical protein